MSELLESLRQSFADPVTRHAMLVHFPIAISVLAVPFVLVLCLIPGRPAVTYRLVLAIVVFATAVVAWQAGEAGEAADALHDFNSRLESLENRACGLALLVASRLRKTRPFGQVHAPHLGFSVMGNSRGGFKSVCVW